MNLKELQKGAEKYAEEKRERLYAALSYAGYQIAREEDDALLRQALDALDCICSPLHVREINKVGAATAALRERLGVK